MLFKSLVTFTVLAQALAAPLAQHQHHQHKEEKRAVQVVTQTNVVTVVLGNGEQTTTFAAPTVSVANTVSVDAETHVPQVQPSTTAEQQTEKETTTSAQTGSSSTNTANTGSAGAKGVTYSPYSADGGCKSSSQIASDIASLSGYTIIRLYGVDCDQVAQVLQAKASSQKIFAGIFDVSDISGGIQTLASAVSSYGSWDDIYTVSIGNELVNSGAATPSQIQSYVAQGRSALSSAGYSGSVVSVDTFIAVINNPALCEYSDYMAVNAHAFFDGHIAAADAGAWVLQQIQRVWTACSGKKNVLITETGWPHQGDANGVAVPSKPNQQSAISSIKSSCGDSSIIFNAYDDLWKTDSASTFNAEKYWGILSS